MDINHHNRSKLKFCDFIINCKKYLKKCIVEKRSLLLPFFHTKVVRSGLGLKKLKQVFRGNYGSGLYNIEYSYVTNQSETCCKSRSKYA